MHDPTMPMIMSFDKLTKAELWHSGQDNPDVKHVESSGNKTIMALIEDHD
jgi:hypothetical protein